MKGISGCERGLWSRGKYRTAESDAHESSDVSDKCADVLLNRELPEKEYKDGMRTKKMMPSMEAEVKERKEEKRKPEVPKAKAAAGRREEGGEDHERGVNAEDAEEEETEKWDDGKTRRKDF